MGIFSSELTSLNLSAEMRGSPLDNPANPINSSAMWDYFYNGEPTVSGESINEANALQITTVYACVTTLATSVASLPLKLMERTANGHQEAVDADVHYILSTAPNPEMSAFTYFETLVGCCALTGNAYSLIERGSSGQIVALWPLNPLKTEPVRLNGALMFKTTDGEAPGHSRLIKAADVLHIPLFSFDGMRGLSPVAMARQALGLAKACEKFGSRLFGNGARPGGLVFNKGPRPDQKVQKEIRESWQAQQGGENQGKTAFLFGGDWSYQSLGMTADESQFLMTRGYQRADIAALFHMPPHFVGDMSRMSGNNSEQEMIKYTTMTLRPYTARFESEIARKLLPMVGRKAGKYFVSFDTSDMLKTDFKAQMEGFSAGIQGGWYTPNQVRIKMGENPAPPESGCDIYRCAVNYTNAALLLTTESIQDQPIGTEPPPTLGEKNMLGSYTTAYISLYRDAFNRLLHRNRRDLVTVDQLFRPVLRCIGDAAKAEFGDFPNPQGDPIDKVITDALRSMGKRVAKWPDTLPEADIVNFAQSEFIRAVRSIHIAVSREFAAAKAAAQLQLGSESEVTEDETV